MSFVLEFLPEAAAELECIAGDYEARNKGLGSRFRAEVESACAAIVRHPFLWRLRPGALVIAVAHASRHPDYFKDRITN